MAKQKSKATRGRPADVEHPERYPVRHDGDQIARWRLAAATCGLTLQDWIRSALDGEAGRAHHVPTLKREGVRRVG